MIWARRRSHGRGASEGPQRPERQRLEDERKTRAYRPRSPVLLLRRLTAEPEKFFITPHYDGYPAVLVRLGQVGFDELAELVTEAWRICAPKRLLAAYDAEHPPAP